MHVRPLKGRVIDPETGKPLPKDGASVKPSSYWYRRLRDGDVAEGAPKKSAPKKAPSPSSNKSSEES